MGDGARVEPPLFTSLRGYHTGWLRGDVVAGLTVWAVLVPEALATRGAPLRRGQGPRPA
jgi:MFS superfamily sulfate permease-like transporter